MKSYVARRIGWSARHKGTITVAVVTSAVSNGDTVDQAHELVHRVHHSPNGFEWGYGGSGPADLARCILWDYFDAEPTPTCYQPFKLAFIAAAPPGGFEITTADIDQWVAWWRDENGGVPATIEQETKRRPTTASWPPRPDEE